MSFFLLSKSVVFGQQTGYPVPGKTGITNPLGSDSANGFAVPGQRICKGLQTGFFRVPQKQPLPRIPVTRRGKEETVRKPLLKVHGNILYDLNYWSNIDTPYADKNVYQHTVQTWLDVLYKDQYPFHIFLTTRFSNSSLFRNFTDLNFRYDPADFNNRVRRQVQGLLQQRTGLDSLEQLAKQLSLSEKKYFALQNWANDPAQLQQLIDAREKKWLKELAAANKGQSAGDTSGKTLPQGWTASPLSLERTVDRPQLLAGKLLGGGSSGDSLKKKESAADSLLKKKQSGIDSLTRKADSVKQEMDSLAKQIAALRARYQSAKQIQDLRSGQTRQDIDQITSGEALSEKLKSLHVPDTALPKGYKTLYSVRSFAIGRSLLNYSELSAKNISVNGVQIEYNPSFYAAFAAGTIDYQFRDFTLQNPAKGQYIALARYGWGQKNGNNIIFTYYTGRRQLYNSQTTAAIGTDVPNYNLMGFTLEGHYKINKTNALVAEVAKSSSPYYSLDSSGTHNVLSSALKMNDRSNEAYSVKLLSFIPVTQTQFTASYQHFGANFQSFSLFTTGSAQSAWSVRLDQPFFQRQLNLTGSIRTNDFVNPLLTTSYTSTTVFKSIQATLRIKKWPVISLGYFPSSQLTKINDSQYAENLFYTLTGSASYIYKVKTVSMLSTFIYTRFYNRVTDSNFVYFNTKNLLFNQHATIGRLTLTLQLSDAMNTSYSLYVAEHRVEYALNKWLSLGAGVKYNKQTVYDIIQYGYSGDATIRVPKLGEFRFLGDKGFIPGSNKQLVENDIGRLTYIKTF